MLVYTLFIQMSALEHVVHDLLYVVFSLYREILVVAIH